MDHQLHDRMLFQNCSGFKDMEYCFVPEKAAYIVKGSWYIPITFVTVYLVAIFSLERFMRNRKPLELKVPLVLWNGGHAMFSILATYRLSPVLYQYLRNHDLLTVACHGVSLGPSPKPLFWIWLHIYSKLFELGDTFFIVLRKRQLIFLHWYHHITVLLFCWLCFEDLNDIGGVFGMMNFIVHSAMYTYFFFTSLRIKIPTSIAKTITVTQILQMFIGCYVTYIVLNAKLRGTDCHVTNKVVVAALLMYTSYLFLFVKYFYKIYLAPKAIKSANHSNGTKKRD